MKKIRPGNRRGVKPGVQAITPFGDRKFTLIKKEIRPGNRRGVKPGVQAITPFRDRKISVMHEAYPIISQELKRQTQVGVAASTYANA